MTPEGGALLRYLRAVFGVYHTPEPDQRGAGAHPEKGGPGRPEKLAGDIRIPVALKLLCMVVDRPIRAGLGGRGWFRKEQAGLSVRSALRNFACWQKSCSAGKRR